MKNRVAAWGWVCLGAGVTLLVVMAVLWGTGVWDGHGGDCDGDCRDGELLGPEALGPATPGQEGVRPDDCCGSTPVPGGVVSGEAASDSGEPALTGPAMVEQMERGFLEQMIPHHEDAVAMARLALTRAEHPELATLAQAVIDSQTREIDQMRAWYKAWYGVDVPAAGDGIAGSGSGGGMMGGGMMGGGMMGEGMMGGGMMGGGTDIQALESAAEFDRAFIEQMIPHHQMGVMMASMISGVTGRPELTGLADAIITTQTAEIEQMRDWHQTWYQ